jgi:hypothetical protein
VRCVVSCQAKSKPRAAGTRAAVPFACWPASNDIIAASPRRRRGAEVASFRSVGWRSSNPSPCWLPLDTAVPRPHSRSCSRRSQKLRRGSVEARTTANPSAFVVLDLRLRDTHPVQLPIDVVPAQRECFRGCAKPTVATQSQDHLPNGLALFVRLITCNLWALDHSFLSRR